MIEHLAHESFFRGDKIVANRASKKVILFGAGALGSWLLDLLARQGYHNLTIIDFDRVEKNNFGTQNYGKNDIGRMKSTQAANNLFVRLGITCESLTDKVTQSNVKKLVKGADLVVDLFDNAESRNFVRDACNAAKIENLHCGMSGDGFVEIEWGERYRAHPNPKTIDVAGQPCEYPLASNLVWITVSLSAEIINRFIDAGVKNSVHFTLKDMYCHRF